MHRLILAATLVAVPAAVSAQTARDNIDLLIEQQAKANGVPASFVHAVVKRESNYNPNAKGGSALGLMQIKHATARSLGYQGDAAGLYDPATNLRYGVAYLAGAYKTAQGNLHQAYQYYNRGYYYAAKRQGVSTMVASAVAPVAASASALASLFTGSPPVDPAAGALAYAPATAVVAAPAESVEVPLPPRRPTALAGGAQVQFASLQADPFAPPPQATPAPQAETAVASVEVPLPPRRPEGMASPSTYTALSELRLSPEVAEAGKAAAEAGKAAAEAGKTAAEAVKTASDSVEVPLPPRRPSARMLAMAAPAPRPVAAPVVQEAVALPPQ